MKDKELNFDRTKHALYTKACKKQIQKMIALHYPPPTREEMWTRIQTRFADSLRKWDVDLGGEKNFHNGRGGTYDCIALMLYYAVCRSVTSLEEIEETEKALVLPSFRALRFVDANKPFFKKLIYRAFVNAKKQCDKWGDYEMNVAPFDKNEPIYYEFLRCPAAEFAKAFGLCEVMPALCNVDYAAIAQIHGRLERKSTCVYGNVCDYTIYGDREPTKNTEKAR